MLIAGRRWQIPDIEAYLSGEISGSDIGYTAFQRATTPAPNNLQTAA